MRGPAYYNEKDPFAAQWLRNLIDAGLIAAGYGVKGGGFNNALGRLRTLELISGRGEIRISETLFE